MIDLLIAKFSFWVPGFMAGLSLFVEEKRRRGELAMYVLPKGLESAWIMARGKGYVVGRGWWGEGLVRILSFLVRRVVLILAAQLTAMGMSMVMVCIFVRACSPRAYMLLSDQSTYQNDPQHLSGFVRRILYQFIGPN